MKHIEIFSNNPNPKQIDLIVNILKNEGIIIYPTDTVYAIGCMSNSSNGLKKILKIKKSKVDNLTLSFMFKNISDLSKYVKPFNNKTYRVLNKYLPGPYAFIMDAQKKLPKPFHKKKEIGVRISENPIIQEILNKIKIPLITSSLHDKNKITQYTSDPKIIYDEWNTQVDLIIDGGYLENIPSTVVDIRDIDNITLIRRGKGSFI